MNNNSNWFVITGGPSSGKSTILTEFKKVGCLVYPETARIYIDAEISKGRKIEDITKNMLEFQRTILRMGLEIEKKAPRDRIVIFDRGIPDSVAYYRNWKLNADEVLKSCRKGAYRKVFLL